MKLRAPAVAGLFYPAGRDELTRRVDALLSAAGGDDAHGQAAGGRAVAYVVPHAGYGYSGATAAYAYADLRRHADHVRRVVLVGPSHRAPLTGCAVPTADAWTTTLGDVPLDRAAIDLLVRAGHAAVDDAPHVAEHALEVQLPFLQRVLPGPPPIVPVAVGAAAADDVAVMVAAVAEPGTVVLCSTDLSHYLDLDTALARDGRTLRAVLDLAPERIGSRDACGVFALRGVVAWARRAGLRANLLRQATSADAGGGPSRVVGYAALAVGPQVANVTG